MAMYLQLQSALVRELFLQEGEDSCSCISLALLDASALRCIKLFTPTCWSRSLSMIIGISSHGSKYPCEICT